MITQKHFIELLPKKYNMDLISNWKNIRKLFKKSTLRNLHVSIASVDTNNQPTVTPIGSVFLNKNQTGYYFEKFPSKLPQCAEHNKNICLLAVDSGLIFWAKSLINLKFKSYPAVKLYGILGQRRKATTAEIAKFHRQLKPFSFFKGHDYLWGDMDYVREITFTKGEKINLGKMTQHL